MAPPGAPSCARFVALRDVPRLPGHVMRLLRAVAGAGEVALLLNPDQRSLASELDASIETVAARTAAVSSVHIAAG